MDWKTIKHFKSGEFDCHCDNCKDKNTGELKMNSDFVEKLDYARINSNVSYDIKNGCGYRCEDHNKNIGGSETSLHPEGKAADIPFKDKTKCFKILYGLFMAGFKRIQVYQRKNGSGWIHCDTYKGSDKLNIWFSIKAI